MKTERELLELHEAIGFLLKPAAGERWTEEDQAINQELRAIAEVLAYILERPGGERVGRWARHCEGLHLACSLVGGRL